MTAGDNDIGADLAARVAAAAEAGTPLEIRGASSKRFLGRPPAGEPLSVLEHRGVVRHQPSELVLTARAGTPIDAVEHALREAGQVLPFDPPRFGGGTLGGAVATGLTGPARAFTGSLRDFVLGVRMINGRGQILRFGGEVMKNVAGYDVSRLMAGALGTLGILLEVSVKVLPAPEHSVTLRMELDRRASGERLAEWFVRGAPITATSHDGSLLRLRLAGSRDGVMAAAAELGGEREPDDGYWESLRDHRLKFFSEGETPLWRLALPPATPEPELDGASLVEWGGQQLWLRSEEAPERIRAAAAALGGHAVLFRGGNREADVFARPDAVTWRLHQRLKEAFDPRGIFNPGRLYADL